MTCPETRIVAFLAGELSNEEERRFDRHLLSCEQCWRAVQADRAAHFALDQLREPAPAGLHDRVTLAVALAAAEASPGHRPWRRQLAAARLRATFARPRLRLVAAASLVVGAGCRRRPDLADRPRQGRSRPPTSRCRRRHGHPRLGAGQRPPGR